MSEPYVGEIRMVGFNFAPAGWATCDGQLLPISQNDTLFALIGTTYGGDGQTTFALPNLQSRVALHAGQGPGLSNRVLSEMAGTEEVTLTTTQIPAHTHPLLGFTETGNSSSPANALPAQAQSNIYGQLPPISPMSTAMVQSTGGSQPHDNMHPYLVINFVISLFGIFPSPT